MSVPCSDMARLYRLAAGLHWMDQNQADVVDVAVLGAKGDGATDDSVAIQSALGAVFRQPDNSGALGSHVYFPGPNRNVGRTGVYRVTCPLAVPGWGKAKDNAQNFSNLLITIHPAATISFEYEGTEAHALFEFATGCLRGTAIIQGGRLTGSKIKSGTPQHGIWIGVQDVIVRDMLIEKFTGNGIIIDAALGGQIATNADVGPIVDRIENCHVFSNGGCGILGNQATAVVVERCRIEGNSQWGLRLRGNGMSVDGNAIESNGDVKGPGNLRIEAASGGTIDASVTNNYFGTVSGQIAPAISVEGNQNGGVSRAFISGNYLVGNQVSKSYAIVVGTENTRGSSGVGNPTASNVTIVGNFIGGFQTGVWIGEGTDRYVVGPNGFASGLAGATENLVPTPMLPGRSAGVFKWTTG